MFYYNYNFPNFFFEKSTDAWKDIAQKGLE
jgi:hypothetical protein